MRRDSRTFGGVSLSTDPEHLARYGVRAHGGPLHGQIVTDSPLLRASIRLDDGCYELRGGDRGGLVYVWVDREAVVREMDEWQRYAEIRRQARLRRRAWRWRRKQ